jgi:hypothetical protein
MTMRQINFLVAAILGAFTIIFYLALGEVPPPSNIYPLTLVYLLAFLILVMLLVNLFFTTAEATARPFVNIRKRRVIGVAASCICFIIGIPYLGFYFSSTVFLFLFTWLLGGMSKKAKDILTSAGVSLVVMVIIYLGFNLFLKVPTPRGIFL